MRKLAVKLPEALLIGVLCLAGCGGSTNGPATRRVASPPCIATEGERIVTLTWNPEPAAPLAKTYVAFDMNPDGTFAPTGKAENGNLGWSAKNGASMSRPPADQLILARIPDGKHHTLHVYAIDSDGYLLPANPVAKFTVEADCK